MNWLLLVVVGIIVAYAIVGLRVGLIKTIFSLCSLVVAIVLTLFISPTVNEYIRGNEKIYNYISDKVESTLEHNATEDKSEDAYIEGMFVPKTIKNSLSENNNSLIYKELGIDNFKDYVNNYMTSMIINALSFMLTFLAIYIALWVICNALHIISKLPVLNQINKTGGLLAGIVRGLIMVWILFIIITVFSGTKFGSGALSLIEESSVLSILYNNNILLQFVTSATKMFL